MTKKILVVGAGIAGLSAGIHALRNGYDAEIYETHNLPGGLCTAWERTGYTFDGCIHWLVGTKRGSQFNRLWREVCDIDKLDIINHDRFMSIEGSGGKTLHIYSDLNCLEDHLLDYSTDDSTAIKEIIDASRVMSRIEYPLDKPDELMKFWDLPPILFKMMPMFKLMGKFSRVSIAEYLAQVKDPFLKEALGLLVPTGYSMISLISTLASQHAEDAGFPKGGSLQFARALESRFLELGGTINYSSRVKEIKVEAGHAKGLLLSDGIEAAGDIVISAADLYHSIYELLKGRYVTPLIKESFNDLPTYTSAQVSIGVDCDLSTEDQKLAVKLDNPITLGRELNNYIYLTNYSFDPTLAPAGKSVVGATLYSSYEYWEGAAKTRELYNEKKTQLSEQVIKIVEKRFPKAKGKIEVTDVATPWSYHRYTGVYKGAYMAWIVPPDSGRFKIPKQLPGLENYYQIGQWVEPPAGLPGSMLTGRQVMQIICKSDKKRFR
ncbi:MAG: phytoene desaturase family protein [Dethiobacteria bacterium]